jgi:hypothetical protein
MVLAEYSGGQARPDFQTTHLQLPLRESRRLPEQAPELAMVWMLHSYSALRIRDRRRRKAL